MLLPQTDRGLSPALMATFSPLHKSAFGIATGLVSGLAILALTAFHVLVNPSGGPDLSLLNQFFYGYSVSWTGGAIGVFWAGFAGFVMGWFAAFVRNLVIAAWIVLFKARADLSRVFDVLSQM